MTSPDEHVPAAGCKWSKCGLDEPETCPLVGDHVKASARKTPENQPDTCLHEWRQVSNVLDLRFYCIHCLTITPLKPEHGIVTTNNRGWTPFD